MKGETNLMDVTNLTVHELKEKLKNKELTISQIMQCYIDNINKKEKMYKHL